MYGQGVAGAVAGTTVLGVRAVAGEGLAATGIAVGIYVLIAAACLMVGVAARWKAGRVEKQV